MPTTLIIGRHDDPHTEAVTLALKNLGQEVVHFDTFRQDFFELGFASVNESDKFLKVIDSTSKNISSVWLRQKPLVPSPWWSPLEHDAARFTQNEWRNLIQSLFQFMPSAKWINNPELQTLINFKPRQLEIANSVGFLVPPTLITNNPYAISDFIDVQTKVIYKTLSGYIFSDQTGILTTILTSDTVRDNFDSIKRAPGIYQKFIEKSYEVRVTVVGSKYFVSRIETPKSGLGSVDWRHSHFDDIFREGEIPNEIAEYIKQFQIVSGIHYGAYDFIVCPNGKWYFLECNPAGQFLWLERALGHKISEALAEDLL